MLAGFLASGIFRQGGVVVLWLARPQGRRSTPLRSRAVRVSPGPGRPACGTGRWLGSGHDSCNQDLHEASWHQHAALPQAQGQAWASLGMNRPQQP
jgi:hypothetical protein